MHKHVMTLKMHTKIQFGVQEWQIMNIFEQILKYLENKGLHGYKYLIADVLVSYQNILVRYQLMKHDHKTLNV